MKHEHDTLLADRLVRELSSRGMSLFTGVPCSSLAAVIRAATKDPRVRYIGATSEGEAVAIAAGTWLGGAHGVAICQNSGLGNMINPITSIAGPCRIPFLMVCSWRGRPGVPDEPQHEIMGRITLEMLDLVGVTVTRLTACDDLRRAILAANDTMRRSRRPACLVVDRSIASVTDASRPDPGSPTTGAAAELPGIPRVERAAALQCILEILDDHTAVVATTGKTARELFALADRTQHFYCIGGMGCASAIAFGVALQTSRRVVVIDGDGAALMKLGNMATIGAAAPINLIHVLLDNGVHDSTGGQATVSRRISLPQIARACGYRGVISCCEVHDLRNAMQLALASSGPHLVHFRIRPGSMSPLGRPSVDPADVAQRFREFVAGAACSTNVAGPGAVQPMNPAPMEAASR